jgi:hypothetical protein
LVFKDWVKTDPKMMKTSTLELAALPVFQLADWHSFFHSSSCGCPLTLKCCDDSECENPNNFGTRRLGKSDGKIGD